MGFWKKSIVALVLCGAVPLAAAGSVLPASIFGSGMVLQRNVEIPVWGTAQQGERVSVSIADQTVSTSADHRGTWKVRLNPMPEGGPFSMRITGSDTVMFSDILIGEVWLCSGQSNMEFPVEKTINAEKEIAAAGYPQIRLFTVKRTVADSPQVNCSGYWQQCDSVSVRSFSGVGYYFGRHLFHELNVPVGLVHSAYGGTPAEAWMSDSALASEQTFRPILERWQQNLKDYPAKKQEFDSKRDSVMKAWDAASARAKQEGRAAPPRPQEPIGPGNRSTPSGLFNGMITPIVPFAFRGVIWYQGESNASRAYQYRQLFPALIRDWRRAWGEELPFYFVQLPNLDRGPEPSRSGWAELREAQRMALGLPRTAMAVTIDIGDPMDLHPRNKQEVGVRLARLAEGLLYGRNTKTCQSPLYRSYRIDEHRVRVEFDHASGLHAKDGNEVKGFVIAGSDKVFRSAQAHIDGGGVVVWSDAVKEPASVRYAWADNPVCNLVNEGGLPASPFRTDDWPEVTFDRK